MHTSKDRKIPGFESALGMLPGLVVFMFLTNGVILNPSYTAWLTGDAFLAWQGWQFFRLSPLIQWPLGANPFFGLEISSSIVFPDSVPLMAFIFKPFSALLPAEFQYFGIFILLCFLLQSLFAYKILRIYSSAILPALLGSALFVLAPILLVRLTETYQHHALFSQWVILAALYFYLRNRFSYAAWIALQVIALLINVYLFSMVFSVFLADLVQRKYLKQITTKTILVLIPITLGAIVLIMWAIGFFMVGSPGASNGLSGGGFGMYRMNLLSAIDSNLIWSKIMPDFYTNKAEEEGFNYLGIGIISLTPIAIYSAFKAHTKERGAIMKYVPLFVLTILCAVYAISNQMYIGGHKIAGYEVPHLISGIFNILSSSGRFFWIPNYLILISVCYLIFKLKNKYVQITLISMAVLIQTGDSSSALGAIKTHFIKPNKTFEKLDSELWESFSKKYKKIIYVDPGHLQSPDVLSLYEFSSSHRMAINVNWQSKYNASRLLKYRDEIANSILDEKFGSDSLYVFRNDELWNYSIDHLPSTDVAYRIHNFKVIAPNFIEGQNQDKEKYLLYTRAPGVVDLSKSNPFVISFLPSGNFQPFRGMGWSHPEQDGTWTDGFGAKVRLNLEPKQAGAINLVIVGRAYVNSFHRNQKVDIYCNKILLGKLTLDVANPSFKATYRIEKSLISSKGNNLFIDFIIPNPNSEKILGLGRDDRLLGIKLTTITLDGVTQLKTK